MSRMGLRKSSTSPKRPGYSKLRMSPSCDVTWLYVIKIRIGWTLQRSRCLSGKPAQIFAAMPRTTQKPAIIPRRMNMLPTVPWVPLSQGSHSRFVFIPLMVRARQSCQ